MIDFEITKKNLQLNKPHFYKYDFSDQLIHFPKQ